MRAFCVGDLYQGRHTELRAEVLQVDACDPYAGVVRIAHGDVIHHDGERVFAAEFLNHWTLIKSGSGG